MRDPRISPEIGDEIARQIRASKSGCMLRKVTRSHGGFVFFEVDNGYSVKARIIPLRTWQRWAKKAEIIQHGRPEPRPD